MNEAMKFLGGMLLICLGLSVLCVALFIGFGVYMDIHDCPANYVRCGVFPIQL